MNKLLVSFLFAVAIAAPSFAVTRSCTTAMVTLNICRSTSDVALCLPVSTVDPDGAGARLAPSVLAQDAFAALYGWTANMTCTAEMVSAAICTAPQLGTAVAVTKAQFTDMIVKRWVLAQLKAYRQQQEQTTATATVEAEAVPDIGN